MIDELPTIIQNIIDLEQTEKQKNYRCIKFSDGTNNYEIHRTQKQPQISRMKPITLGYFETGEYEYSIFCFADPYIARMLGDRIAACLKKERILEDDIQL